MSLDYQLKEIKNFEQLCFYMGPDDENPKGPQIKKMNPITYALIWITIPIQCGVITEKNYEQVFKRIYLNEQIFGAFNRRHGKKKGEIIDVPITLKDVQDHIGLRTNVPCDSEAVFRKYVTNRIFDEQYRAASRIILDSKAEEVPA